MSASDPGPAVDEALGTRAQRPGSDMDSGTVGAPFSPRPDSQE